MSYVNRKTKLFRAAGDHGAELGKKRSDGRMKTYHSATDARAWCLDKEDRREYILDLVNRKSGKSLSLGKYVPIEAIIDILLASANDEIMRLQKLLAMYESVMTDEQKRKIAGMKAAGDAAASFGSVAGPAATSSPIKGPGSPSVLGSAPGDTQEATSGQSTPDEMEKGEQDMLASMKDDTYSSSLTPDGDIGAFSSTDDEDVNLIVDKDTEIIDLKNALAAKEAYCEEQRKIALQAIEQLETIRDIVEERDQLRRQLEASQRELQTLRRGSSGATCDNCKQEIEALEREIEDMRQGAPSPDREAEIIRKEVEVLKKYCTRLQQMQAENNELKRERDCLRSQVSGDCRCLLDDNDRLKLQVENLEMELEQYRTLPDEVESYRRKSEELDQENSDLQIRLDKLKGLEDIVNELKKKADKVEELEKKLKEMEKIRMERDKLKCEKERLQAKVCCLEQEICVLKCKANEVETLKIERNCLKMRVDELCCIQCQFEELLLKTQGFDKIKNDNLKMKMKIDELMCAQCECDALKEKVQKTECLEKELCCLRQELKNMECYIAAQENEIKRLTCHIECLTRGRDQQQEKMKQVVTTMRAEIDQKNCLICCAEKKLAEAQEQLANCIQGVSCETTCLRQRVAELEQQLDCSTSSLMEKEDQIDCMCVQIRDKEESGCEVIVKLKQENDRLKKKNQELLAGLKNSMKGDPHMQEIMMQSKCAVIRITEALGKKYQELDETLKEEQESMEKGPSPEEIEGMQNRIRELEEQLKEAQNTICTLNGDMDELGEKLTGSMAALENAAQENRSLRRNSLQMQESAKSELNTLKGQLNERLQEVTNLKQQNAMLSDELDRLRLELQNERMKNQQSTARASREFERTKADLESAQHKLSTDLSQLSSRNLQLDNDMKKLQDQIKKLQEENGNLKKMSGATDSLAQERDNLLKQIDQQKLEISDLLKKLAQTGPSGDDCAARLEKEKLEKEKLQSVVADLEKQIKNLGNKGDSGDIIDDYIATIKNLEAELAKQKKECGDTINSLKTDLQNLKEKTKSQENLLRQKDDQLKQSKMNVRKLSKERDKLQSDISDERRKSLTTPPEPKEKKKLPEPEAVKEKPAIEPKTAPPKLEKASPSLEMKTFQEVCICGKGEKPRPGTKTQTGSNRDALQKQIENLERNLLCKQKQAKEKVEQLQCQVCHLRQELQLERQKNDELVTRNKAQTKVVCAMQDDIDQIKGKSTQKSQQECDKLKCQLDDEKYKVKQLAKMLAQHRKETDTNKSCTCKTSSKKQSVSSNSDKSSFYTELTVKDVQTKRTSKKCCD